jgi:ribonuclease HI
MELTAVIKALEALKKPCKVRVVTDSNYIVQGITAWIFRWLKNNWKNSQKQNVINQDLWERLLNRSNLHDIKWEWIKGHSDHPENERCDKLARLAIKRCKKKNNPPSPPFNSPLTKGGYRGVKKAGNGGLRFFHNEKC